MKKGLICACIIILIIAVVAICFFVTRNNKSNVSGNNGELAQEGNNEEIVNNESDTTQEDATVNSNSKILIVYFSQTGNTDKLANEIQKQVGGDLFKLEPVNPYPSNMQELLDYTEKEQEDGVKPEIKGAIENIEQYDTVFIGYPIWWYEVPQIIKSFLDQYDLSGKKVIPFNTHEGSGDGGTYEYIEQQEPNATVLEGLPIRGRNMSEDQSKTVENWLDKLGF